MLHLLPIQIGGRTSGYETMTRARTRYAIAMTAVMAAALCADRALAVAPQVRPQSGSVASRVMNRLSQSLRRAVPSVKVVEARRDGDAIHSTIIAPEPVLVQPPSLSPFQFRLPPPIL